MATPLEFLFKVRRRLLWRRDAAVVMRAGLFDREYYREQNPDVANAGIDPVEHYLRVGAYEGRDPHPLFISSYYLRQNPHLVRLGSNPLLHYIRVGDRRGIRPNPYFEPEFYRARCGGRLPAGRTALRDYLERGDRALPPCNLATTEDAPDIPAEEVERAGGWLSAALTAWRRGMSYGEWVERYDTLDEATIQGVRERYGDGTDDLLFRFCVVDQGTDEEFCLTLESLRGQINSRWELVVLRESVGDAARGLLAREERVRFVASTDEFLAPPAISGCRVFAGPVCVGAVLCPHYLSLLEEALRAQTATTLVYTDEDTFGGGARRSPIFKPDWDPLLAAQIDLVGGSGVVALERLRKVNEDCQVRPLSFESLFRVAVKGMAGSEVVHLPRVLVHLPLGKSWSARQASDGADRPLSPTRLEKLATEVGGPWRLLSGKPHVSIIVPTRDRVELLRACLESVACTTDPESYEVVVVDNGSTEPETLRYLEEISARPAYRVIAAPGEFNYAALNNRAVAESSGEILCFLNNDIEIRNPGWLEAMTRFAGLSGTGAVGSVLLYPDGTVQHGGVILGAAGLAAHSFVGETLESGGYMGLLHYAREVGAVTAACLVVRRAEFEAVGGFDAGELAVNFNDVDLCLKLRQRGLRNVILPLDGVVHHESKSRIAQASSRERLTQMKREASVMARRWGELLQRDPHYNDNLSLGPETYRLASPPRVEPLPRRSLRRQQCGFSSLGRDERLDIYADGSNETRVAEVTRPGRDSLLLDSVPRGVSVLILNKNAPDYIVPLIEQLAGEADSFAAAGLGFEVIIGDTGSTDERTRRAYETSPACIKVVEGLEYNFSRCNNDIEGRATFNTALFMNNDIILPSARGALLKGYTALKADSSAGVLGAVLQFPNGTIQHMGCELLQEQRFWGLPIHLNARSERDDASVPSSRYYPSVTGAFLMIDRALFRRCGRFDPDYRAECQDVALCLEAHRLGYRSVCVDLGRIVHIENGTRPKGEEHWGDRRRFLRRYGAYIQGSFL